MVQEMLLKSNGVGGGGEGELLKLEIGNGIDTALRLIVQGAREPARLVPTPPPLPGAHTPHHTHDSWCTFLFISNMSAPCMYQK